MKKTIKMMICAFVLAIMPFISVNAASANVTDQDGLKEKLADATVDTIVLDNDIETTEKINITRPVVIDGQGHAIKYVGTFRGTTDNTTWDGIYVLQVYATTATIKDVQLTGGNAALLVNGSNVTLEGTIDVSGNGFGGIELSKGAGVATYPYVDAQAATLVNTTESATKPTVWTDGMTLEEMANNNSDFVIDESAMTGAGAAYKGDIDDLDTAGQFQIYLKKENVPTEDGYVEIPLEEEEPTTPTEPTPTPTPETPKDDTKVSENPNTYDGILSYIGIAVLGFGALAISSKKVLNK